MTNEYQLIYILSIYIYRYNRVGRTARAGASGTSVALLEKKEVRFDWMNRFKWTLTFDWSISFIDLSH